MTDLLRLHELKTVAVQEESDTVYITAEMKTSPYCCQACGVKRDHNLSKFGKRVQVFADAPLFGQKVKLRINRQRFKCHDCGSTFLERMSDIDDNHKATVRLVEYIQRESFKRTFTSIAEEVGVTEGTVRNIFKEYADLLNCNHRRIIPNWVGMDEIHIIKKPRFIFTNIQDRRIIDILPDRNKATVYDYFFRLHNKRNIQYVTMDMWAPYRDVTRQLMPDAKVIIDKFHVVKMANSALDTVRKTLKQHLTTKERRSLKNDRFLLLKRSHELKDKQRDIINSWMEPFPLLYNAYVAKEFFYEIFDSKDRYEAHQRYKEWRSLIDWKLETAFYSLITAMDNWREEIYNYFEMPLTNAYTESFNSLIRQVHRMSRGYTFDVLRAKLILTKGFKKVYRPKFEKYHKPVKLRPLDPELQQSFKKAISNYIIPISTQDEVSVTKED